MPIEDTPEPASPSEPELEHEPSPPPPKSAGDRTVGDRELQDKLWKRILKSTQAKVAVAITAAIALVGALDSTFNVWDRVSALWEGDPALEAEYETVEPTGGEAEVGGDLETSRAPGANAPTEEDSGESSASEGEDCYDDSQSGAEGERVNAVYDSADPDSAVLVHDDPLDESAQGFTSDEMVELGGKYTGKALQVEVSNPTDSRIDITDIEPEVDPHDAPAGTVWADDASDNPGGTNPHTHFSIDLMPEPSEARLVSGDCGPEDEPYFGFGGNNIDVDPGTTEYLDIAMSATDCTCEVRLRIEYEKAAEDIEGTLTVPPDGEDPITVLGEARDGYEVVYSERPFPADPERIDCSEDPDAHELCAGSG